MEQITATMDREATETAADLTYADTFDAAAWDLTGQLARHDREMSPAREIYAESVRPTPEEIYARWSVGLGKCMAWPSDGCEVRC